MKQKKIKIQYRNRATSAGYSTVPMIQLTGLWLESLGYQIGDTVMMEYGEDGIRIRPLTKNEQADTDRAALDRSIKKKQRELDVLKRQALLVAEPGNIYG